VGWGRSLRVRPRSFCASLILCGCTWTTFFHVMKRTGITVMDFWMYFGFMYGILFDGRIITRKTRKSHRNTENIKNRLDGTHVVPSPAPTRNPRKSTEFTKRGTGAEKWMLFSFIWGAGGGEAFEYTRRRFAPPFPADRIGFVQAGFFGCTSVSCKGFFLMTVSSHGKHRNHTETRKIKKIGWMEPM